MLKIAPILGAKMQSCGTEVDLWAPGKTFLIEKSIAKHRAKHTFGNTAKTRAVRKGELLRGMVSQGRPDPLRHSVKVLRSDSAKRIS